MGIANTKNTTVTQNVFEKELKDVTKIINNILTDNNIYANNDYNLFLKNTCDRYTLIYANRLQKYPTLDISPLNQSIFMLKNENINKTKKQMCHDISVHFTRILRILYLIKYIYDIENNGDRSIGGIVLRNLKLKDDLFQLTTCDSFQEEINGIGKGVKMSNLKGFDIFVNNMLTKQEGQIFKAQLANILGSYNKKQLKTWICKDLIVDIKTNEKIHNTRFKCQAGGSPETFMKVAPHNPILSWNLCMTSKKLIARQHPDLLKKFKLMKSNYKLNFSHITNIMNQLVYLDIDQNEFKLKNISHEQLDNIEKIFKRTVILFFVQSLLDYKNILNTIKLYAVDNE